MRSASVASGRCSRVEPNSNRGGAARDEVADDEDDGRPPYRPDMGDGRGEGNRQAAATESSAEFTVVAIRSPTASRYSQTPSQNYHAHSMAAECQLCDLNTV